MRWVHHPFLWIAGGAALAVATLLLCAAAQQPFPSEKPTIQTQAQTVIVDIVVTDKNGAPVRGLKPSDFAVTEDGKPQRVDYFEEHAPIAVDLAKLPPMPAMPPGVFTNVPRTLPSDSVNLLLLDALNTPPQDQSYVNSQVEAFLKTANPQTPIAVFSLTSHLRMVEDFTTDPKALLAALTDKKSGLWPEKPFMSHDTSDDLADQEEIQKMQMMLGGGGGNGRIGGGGGGRTDAGVSMAQEEMADYAAHQGDMRITLTLEALEDISRFLQRQSGRKNLIWFSSYFPVSFMPRSRRSDLSDKQKDQIREVTNQLSDAQIAVYPIGARGGETQFWSGAESYDSSMRISNMQDSRTANSIMAAQAIALQTGGEAVHGTNDLSLALGHALDDGSHYYTLSYDPTNRKWDGKFRRIDIALNAPDAASDRLSYRRGYYAIDQQDAQTDPRPGSDPLLPLMGRGMPQASQILYGVKVSEVEPQPDPHAARAGGNANIKGPLTRYRVDFLIRSSDLQIAQMGESRQGTLQLDVAAWGPDGRPVNWTGGTLRLNLKPDTWAEAQKNGLLAHVDLDLPKNGLWLTTGVYDWRTGKAGTLEIPMQEVPPPAKGGGR